MYSIDILICYGEGKVDTSATLDFTKGQLNWARQLGGQVLSLPFSDSQQSS